jgi:hypothetical protein
MWNITSNSVQQARQALELRRTEIETRYAEEKQALDTEVAVIESLERAAAEFMLRHSLQAGTDAEPPPSADPPAGSEGNDRGKRPKPATQAIAGDAAEAPLSPVESSPAEPPETSGGLDIVKPGSRWRLYRAGSRAAEAEGDAVDDGPQR